ncbi:MAG: DUF1549 and DUF1553 domain-containing protein [Bryobacteraceae bacterium]|nr:DUF1549 and DUF1553 domain-containing protein [Bryobacteraceae bacterium]
MRLPAALLAISGLLHAADCEYQRNASAFLEREARAQREIFQRVSRLAGQKRSASGAERTPASALPPRNFIDEEIFGELNKRGIVSAPLATDEEFLRRVTLDLTGRLPSPADLRAFLANEDPAKRDAVIDALIGSAPFVDKWTMWWGDLLENCNFPALFDRRDDGRNAYYAYLKRTVQSDTSLRDMVQQLITASGNHYDAATGNVNFPISAKTSMGPSQDTYDNGLVKTATYFLGMSQYDCLLCHNGRGHLDELNLWGSRATRNEAWRMAAHFSRLNMPSRSVPTTDFYYFSFDVTDRTTGTYDLNTTTGNRPTRAGVPGALNLTPIYRDGTAPPDGNWRAFFGSKIYQDPMFAYNFANRFWREFFGMGLVEPFDMLDPERLDPANPPPAPWKLQATHPVLFQKLAEEFRASDFDMRYMMRFLLRSNAYQMSSRYDGNWTLDLVPLFARHYPRRLWSEEIHDVLSIGSGLYNNYTLTRLPAVRLAMQFPDTDEPRGDGNTASFLNSFLRGNRDSRQRSADLSILQRMAIMNDNFVSNRTRATAPNLATIFKITDNAQAVEELFLTFLGRRPDEKEARTAIASLASGDRNTALEDLAWACVNKAEFLFSY